MTELGDRILGVLASKPDCFWAGDDISEALGENPHYFWKELGKEIGDDGNIRKEFYETKYGIPDSYKITEAGFREVCNPQPDLTLEHIIVVNATRCEAWHKGEEPWTAERWITAIVGELGEMANNVKKQFRAGDGSIGILKGETIESLQKEEHKEWADTMLYMLLYAHYRGINASESIREVFNAKSKQLGFVERL